MCESHRYAKSRCVQVTIKPTAELWDQLRDLVRTMPWTTQDEAMWQLIPEMKNIYPVFAVRKSDGLLLGGVAIVVTDIVFGPFYVMRPGIRGNGIGMKMMGPLLGLMAEPVKTRAIIGRAVTAMIEKYSGPPFYAIHKHEMYAFGLPREELLNLFPCTANNTLVPKSFKEMNAEQFEKVCAYDQMASGRDRRDFLKQYHSLFFTKVTAMIEKYSGPPFYAIHKHEMYAFGLPREELLNLFPCTANNTLVPKSFKEMNAEQFEKVCAYDQMASGRDRRDFLKQYHSLFFTKGVALLNAAGEVQGIAGAVPTLHSGQIIKVGPISTATRENACLLIKCITDMFTQSDLKFVLHVSTDTAGDWILKKCHDANIPLTFVGTAANATYSRIIYKDPCNTELMFVPMNCPIYFDR
ncbi:hypothetical protein OESDEN_02549 [Oesophagostomum dentatum]|uniref:YitH/HolE acetyltransferase (GNAT) domain-containing protein n=1 Tax=Oesophagostomum dentatum TaxID=61180 RepID=A0A0B1TMY4_OESDE|nr:hypothetical protein OESDEN_02549 [Oesophagostomum dentatum]